MPNISLGRWTKSIVSKSVVMAAAFAVVGCHQDNETIAPFDPRAMQQNERQAAVGIPPRQIRPMPTTLESPFPDEATTAPSTQPTYPPTTGPAIGTEETVIRMPLREIIQRAVANNADIKVAGYDPAIDETRVTEAEAKFDPTFFTNFQYGIDRILAPTPDNPTIVSSPLGETTFRTYTIQSGIKQDLESGGKVELDFDPAYTRRSPNFDPVTEPGAINPFWTSDVKLQITQPLLRDFGTDVNTARIVINKNTQRISLLEFRKTLEQNLADIEKFYWQEVDAEQEVKIAEELLDRTLATGKILHDRITQDVGRVQMSQTTSSIESRRTALIRARAHVRDLSDQLKQKMNDPDMPVAGSLLILPSDEPLETHIAFDEADQINTAMENRFELAEQQFRTDNAATAAIVAKNNLLPQLNFVGSVGTTGLGESFGNAVTNDFDSHLEYSMGVQLEIPIGNRAARAIWKRAQLQRLQAITQYRSNIDQVALDVRTAVREVNTTYEEMVGQRSSRFAAADALAAVEEREKANEALTPEFVNRKLDLQQSLADAQVREVQAITAYQVALSKLEQGKGTLLRYDNVTMAEAPLPSGDINK